VLQVYPLLIGALGGRLAQIRANIPKKKKSKFKNKKIKINVIGVTYSWHITDGSDTGYSRCISC